MDSCWALAFQVSMFGTKLLPKLAVMASTAVTGNGSALELAVTTVAGVAWAAMLAITAAAGASSD